jgi:hypothetical protein
VEDCIAHLHSGQKQWQCHRSEEALYANYLHLSGCTWDLGPKVECCTPWLFSMAQQRPHYFGEALCDWHLQTPSNCFRTQHDHRFGEKRCVNSLPQLGCSLRPCPRVEPITFIVAASDDRTITSEKHTMSKACSNLGVSHTHIHRGDVTLILWVVTTGNNSTIEMKKQYVLTIRRNHSPSRQGLALKAANDG